MTPFKPGNHAFVLGVVVAVMPVAVAIGDVDLCPYGAIEQRLLLSLGEALPRRLGIESEVLCNCCEHAGEVLGSCPVPRSECSSSETEIGIWHDQVRIDLVSRSKSNTRRT